MRTWNKNIALLAGAIFFTGIFTDCGILCAEDTAGAGISLRAAATPLTIHDGIVRVLKDNRLVKIESADKDIAFEDTLLALSPLLPHLRANVVKVYNEYKQLMKFGPQSIPVSDKDPIVWGFDVYQTLFDFGKSISNYRASTEAFHARQASVESVKRIVSLEFVVSYFDMLEAEKMAVVAEKEVESLTAYLGDMQHLYEEGVIVKNDLLPARVKLADAKQQRIEAHNRRDVMAARIKTILTMPLTDEISAVDIEMDELELPKLEDAWCAAEAKRPEMRFYDSQIKASVMSERAKLVENLPTLFVDAGYSYTQNKYQVYQDNTYLQLGAKANFYDGGATGAEIMKERYRQGELKERKRKLVDDIRLEIKDSRVGFANACEKFGVAKDVLAQADENVRVNRVKYNNGVATSTDVLEAITLQTKAQTNYYRAAYEMRRYYAKFMYAMGTELLSVYAKTETLKNGTGTR